MTIAEVIQHNPFGFAIVVGIALGLGVYLYRRLG